jgi:hypothetical protein
MRMDSETIVPMNERSERIIIKRRDRLAERAGRVGGVASRSEVTP